MRAPKEKVRHPRHYNVHPSGIECIQIARHFSFNVGNAFKYLWRADEKGEPIEDLEKAAFYIADEIALRRERLRKKKATRRKGI